MYIFEILIFAIVSLLCYIKFKNRKNYWEKRGVPFQKPLPLIGNMADVLLLRKNLAFLVGDLYSNFEKERYFGMWLYTIPHLIIKCPELIKHILVKDFDHFNDRNVANNEDVDPLSANMLLFSLNPKWKFLRSKTTPMFSSGKMKYIYPQIQSVAKDMASFVSAKCKETIEVKELAVKYATDLICSSAFGINAQSFHENATSFANVGKEVVSVSFRNTFTAATYFCKSSLVNIFRIKFVPTSTAKFLTESSLNIIKERELRRSNRKDLVDIMINFKNEHNFKDHELAAQASQFFLAGHETISTAIGFTLYEIALNKPIQDRLRREIYCNIDVDGDVSYETLKSMEYLNKVFLEGLRKYPPFPFLTRRCGQDYKIPYSDLIIEEGTAILISLTGLQHDPKNFPNPEVFDPERFSDENVNSRHPFCFLPFGEGQRNCIGKRMGLFSVKLALFHIIKNFEIDISTKTKVPLEFEPRIFTLFSDQIFIDFKQINGTNIKQK